MGVIPVWLLLAILLLSFWLAIWFNHIRLHTKEVPMEKATLREKMKTALYDLAVSSFGSTVPSLVSTKKFHVNSLIT